MMKFYTANNILHKFSYTGNSYVNYYTKGRLFDKDGNLVEWWSNETITSYNEHALCFVDQYNGFFPPELVEAGINISVSVKEIFSIYYIFIKFEVQEPVYGLYTHIHSLYHD